MKGRNGRNYILDVKDKGEDAYFKVIDAITEEIVDDGWIVISKNGTLRVERIK